MPRRFALYLSLVAFLPGLAAGGTNLIANPRFDAGISGWNAGGPAIVSWSAVDELAHPGSGSLHMTAFPANQVTSALSDCFAVTPGAAIVFGASAYGAESADQEAYLKLFLYDGPNCSGSVVASHFSEPGTEYVLGASTWGPTQGNAAVPAAAQSGRLSLRTSLGLGESADDLYFDNVFVYEGESCAGAATVGCLNDRRFRVTITWQIPDGTHGYGSIVPFSGDSLRATFFGPGNVEIVLKVLDGCPVNQRYWVFAAGLTNVAVKVRVTDTHTGETWEHDNPLDQAFAPVQDTGAFEACPH